MKVLLDLIYFPWKNMPVLIIYQKNASVFAKLMILLHNVLHADTYRVSYTLNEAKFVVYALSTGSVVPISNRNLFVPILIRHQVKTGRFRCSCQLDNELMMNYSGCGVFSIVISMCLNLHRWYFRYERVLFDSSVSNIHLILE